MREAHSIGDNSRRDFCQLAKSQQAIDASSRRDFHPQVKSQQAIAGSSRRDFHPQVKSQQAKSKKMLVPSSVPGTRCSKLATH
ncbi:hypothetical protein COT30_01795 [Candidatus Micrarchaeota archaeon CG08_land_8_20_14_0_20_49_17]|nr:MAG: hypothetical protein COT30_01795 [Candidatus Micrarchaeota archaeon CG08_land_8_20_14_0_20_49_17]